MTPKLRRWTDLLAALLRRHFPVSLEELVAEVPGYQSAPSQAALRRTFERDKDELRSFGIPIETATNPAGEAVGYRLRPENFYLPYLAVAGAPRPQRINRERFRTLSQLSFEPDQLGAIVEAAERVEAMGDPSLTSEVRSACRKLAVDLPLDAAAGAAAERMVPARTPVDPAVFDGLDEALSRRKRVTFDYHSMGTDAMTSREVEPLGLFFLGQHWYLAAREPDTDAIKNFRLSRIVNVQPNRRHPGTPDYDIPPDFRLKEHARSRQAWELGDGDEVMVEVQFVEENGAAMAAQRFGELVPDHPARRRFRVRRLDTFVRWLLSLGGAATPVAPAELMAEYRRQLDATRGLYPEVTR